MASIVNAQDLEPRSLSAIPTVGSFAIASYGYSCGISTCYGANFTAVLLAYQFMWFDKLF